MSTTRQKGQQIELLAEQFLITQGLSCLARNHHCRFGELDLVMQQGATVVFVEVRYRSNPAYGSGADSVTAAKQQKLRLAAEHYLQNSYEGEWPDCRFDVISASGRFPDIHFEWVTNAF